MITKNIKALLLFFAVALSSCAKRSVNVLLPENIGKQELLNSYLTAGLEYYRNAKFEQARAEFEKFFSEMDVNAVIEFEHNISEGARQDMVREYIERMEPVLLDRTASIQSLHIQGKALYEAGQYRPAIEYFAKVLVLAPNHQEAIEYITMANEQIQRLEKDLNRVELEKRKQQAQEQYEKGLKYYHKKKIEEAYLEFMTALNIYPDHVEAKEYCDKLKTPVSERAKEYYKKGLDVYSEGDIKGAIVLWERTLKLLPGYPQAQKALERAKGKLDR